MLVNGFLCILVGAAVSAALCLLGAMITYFCQGETLAVEFLRYYVIQFDGILVGASSYGLLFFVMTRGKEMLAELNKILIVPESHIAELSKLRGRSVSFLWANLISLPLTATGVIVFSKCGFPLQGFARLYLTICVNSIWYAASTVLAFLFYSLLLFNRIDVYSMPREGERIGAEKLSAFSSEQIDNFFIVCSSLALAAIYIGFRGGLTGFTNVDANYARLLILPVIFYLPATLFYSLYPRYVLRQVFDRDVMVRFAGLERQIEVLRKLGLKDKLELLKLLYEVRVQALLQGQGSSLLGVKDVPSFTLGLLIVIQFVTKGDSIIKGFFGK